MTPFKAERVVRTYTMTVCAPPADVFPLLCPVREYEWIEPWSCDMIFSAGGMAENNAVFKTHFPAQGGQETWIVCRYEKDRAIEFIRLVPDLKVNRLDLSLTAQGGGTVLTWTHTYTGLSEPGNQWIRALTDEAFRSEKAALERMLDHYLKTGTMLKMADLDLETDPYAR
ncbi:hypothetical protein DSCA_34210 [Desulfosarcina alkanivorans]|jgi:hypothetical protein|uniref:Polyketide cyclase n=1 Tax=Desulfosarcina alkanivorans TaxID=571177 RepID=A0A5K7YR79_9BACT|nr:SRPBCC family protein [Desulfosarcina alkanivorans]BBO69491.1 hypothetical protein DSCA_34210 [Desulfosarcina alkanivorans]